MTQPYCEHFVKCIILFQLMLASFVSQTEGLMRSKGPKEVREEMMKSGKSDEAIETILPHAVQT